MERLNLAPALRGEAPPTLPEAIAPFGAQLDQLEVMLRDATGVGFDLLVGFLESTFSAGGKRLRPALVFAVAAMGPDLGASARRRRDGYPPDAILKLATGVETLHTATLVHDDLVDGAATRRGRPTLHSRWGMGATILAGDWLFARASSYVAATGSVRVVQHFARTLEALTDGELRQLLGRHGLPSMQDYEDRVYGKTASLFETATEGAGELIGAEAGQLAALKQFGRALGMAFQIIDDLLDFTGDEQTLGKPVGGDLRSGQVTLPALLHLRAHPPAQPWPGAKLDPDAAEALITAIRADAASLAATRDAADRYLAQALASLSALPAGAARTRLEAIAGAAVARDR